MKTSKKTYLNNIVVMVLIVAFHVIALFSSPFFLGPNYSKKVLIDDYCKNNGYGNSLIIRSNISHEMYDYDDIVNVKNSHDSEYNTILGISFNNALVNGKNVSLVGTSQSKSDGYYNNYRIYSENRWGNLKTDNYVYIPLSMVPDFASDPKYVINEKIDILINGTLYNFKIGGVYSNTVTIKGWQSRGNYFDSTFSNCIFVNDMFLSDKFDCLFQMFSSDSAESGNIFDRFSASVDNVGASITQSKNLKEIKLLNDLVLLNKDSRNKLVQTLIIVFSSIVFLLILCASIYLFKVINFNSAKTLIASFVWCAGYYALSCVFLLIIKNRIFSILGFNAYGANNAILNILAIFFILFFLAIFLKTFLKYKKEPLKEKCKQSIFFVTKAKFPNENAFSTYINGLASIYKKAGFDVICIGNGYTKQYQIVESHFCKYVSIRSNKKSFISKIFSQLFFESRVFRFLTNNFDDPTHIFFSSEFSQYFCSKIKKYYSDSNCGCSFIITEEYTKDEFENYNLLSRRSLASNRFFLNKYYDKDDSFIAISRYLQNKILNRKMKCVYVPFCFHFEFVVSARKNEMKHDGINYIYCGNPENKDLLPTIINAFSSLGDRTYKNNIHLEIIGVDEEWATKHGILTYDKEIITFRGRQSREYIFNKYSECDYSVLLRDENKTFAKAGFPTKISESMTFGVVPITNQTSNLSDYLNSGNSVIVNGHEIKDFINAIDDSIKEKSKLSSRKKSAIKTANKYFNIETYSEELLGLIKK